MMHIRSTSHLWLLAAAFLALLSFMTAPRAIAASAMEAENGDVVAMQFAQATTADTQPQSDTAKSAPPGPIEGTPATVVDGQQLESILGRKVKGENGDDMGRIVDLLSDKTGQIRAAIIDFGGFLGVGNRQIAVDWKMVRFPNDVKADSVTVPLSRDQLRVAPAYKAGEQVVVLGPGAPAARPATPPGNAAATPSPSSETSPDAPKEPASK